MKELDPEAKHLLQLVREARTPTAHDRARVTDRLQAALALAPALLPSRAAAQLPVKLKLALAVFGVAAIGTVALTYPRWRGEAHAPQHRVAMQPVPHVVPERPTPEVARAAAEPAPVAQPEAAERAPAVSAKPPRESTLARELSLLHAAQAQWRSGEPAAALARLREHRKLYPRSQLWSERDALQVLCLCALGREAEARPLGRHFLTAAPKSPLRTSVQESCAGR